MSKDLLAKWASLDRKGPQAHAGRGEHLGKWDRLAMQSSLCFQGMLLLFQRQLCLCLNVSMQEMLCEAVQGLQLAQVGT